MFREDAPGVGDFNLNDAVKLYAMDKGVKVQFIEERSVRASDQCKVLWGLSTSIYAKANDILWQPSEVQDNPSNFAPLKNRTFCVFFQNVLFFRGAKFEIVTVCFSIPAI